MHLTPKTGAVYKLQHSMAWGSHVLEEVDGVSELGIGLHSAPVAAPEGTEGGAPAVAVVPFGVARTLGCEVHDDSRPWFVASGRIVACTAMMFLRWHLCALLPAYHMSIRSMPASIRSMPASIRSMPAWMVQSCLGPW